jgi:catechol-2,3-dioxygenase
VQERYRAARFYTAIFNAEVDHESDSDRVKQGKARSLQVGVNLCEGIQLDLFEQDYGQPTAEQAHPHHAFDIRPEDVPAWIQQLSYWRVPFAGPMTRSGTTGLEIYFNDPDGNHLELHCSNYPEHERAQLPTGPYDKRATMLHEWPTSDRMEEADRQLAEKLEAMRRRGGTIT